MTTAERRLATLEASLSPTELVLRWLDEAHGFVDLDGYLRALIEADPGAFPMDRLAREAKASARRRSRGLPRQAADAAVRRAIIETVFRVELVLAINVSAAAVLDREVLAWGMLSAHLGLTILASSAGSTVDPPIGLAQVRDLALLRVRELHAFEAARASVEARYLAGVSALFPAGLQAWAKQRTQTEWLAAIALRLAELDGIAPPAPDDLVADPARVAELAADLVEPARSRAYDELGDGRRALALAVDWLRSKLAAEGLAAGRGWAARSRGKPEPTAYTIEMSAARSRQQSAGP